MEIDPVEVMKSTQTFAILGASANESSYGFKLVKNLCDVGYHIFPINPKYETIYGIKCFKSLDEIPSKIQNIVFALSPSNSLKLLNQINIDKSCYVWFPPECWNEELLETAKNKELRIIVEHCPIGTYLKLNYLKQHKEKK